MIYLFDGDEEFGKAEALLEMRAAFADSTVASMNTNVLDGARTTPAALEEAAYSMPFLAERRLVIVEGMLAAMGARKGGGRKRAGKGAESKAGESADRVAATLAGLPSSTDLVFVEQSAVAASHPLMAGLKAAGVERRTFAALNPRRREDRDALTSWIKARTAKKGSRIEPTAIAALMNRVGANLRQLDQELEKLAVYSGSAVITDAVVQLLVADTRESDVWEIVRAIGAQDTRGAMRTLHALIEAGERPEAIFFQIVRQLRMLLQVASLTATAGGERSAAERLGLQDWQVRQFREQLAAIGVANARRIYRQLLATDVAIKTGRIEPELALDLLVGELCGAR